MSVDSGGPAFSGDKIVAWYLPAHFSEATTELFKDFFAKHGITAPIIWDEGRSKVETEKESYQGMSLRDWFAGQYAAGQARIIPDGPGELDAYERKLAMRAYFFADALIARKRETQKGDEKLDMVVKRPKLPHEMGGDQMSKENWKWSGLKEDLENFPGDNLIMLPPQGVSDPSLFRVSKDRILQLIDDAKKAECQHLQLIQDIKPGSFPVCESCGKVVRDLLTRPKPKTVGEEILGLINGLSYDWSDGAFCTRSNLALRKALAEVVEWMDEGYGYLLDGAKSFQASKTEIEIMRSILAILKGEKTRGIRKS